MRKLLFLLLFLPLLVNAQLGIFKKHTDIHVGPTFSSPYVVVPGDACCGGGLYTPPSGSETSGGDVTPNGNFNGSPGGFSARQWLGDATHIWRIMPTAGTILGTALGSGHGYSQTGYGNYQYLYGQSVANPGVSQGQFGVFFIASTVAAGGGHYLVQNWVAKTTGAGSFQANSTNGGTGLYYDTLRVLDCRSFTSGQEGIYQGLTSSGGAIINYSYVKNFFAYNPNREAGQIRGCNSFNWSNITGVGAGQGGVGGQTNNFQIQDAKGRLHHSLFWLGVTGANIIAHGVRLDHNLISWTTSRILLGRTDSQVFAGDGRCTGDSIIVENNCIRKEGAVETYAFDIQLRDAPIIFRNNTLDNITNMWQDNRAPGGTNTITGNVGDHGNVSGTCPTPTTSGAFSDPDNYAYHGLLLSNDPWRNLGYGYRSVNINP